jgi:hypothetical protein
MSCSIRVAVQTPFPLVKSDTFCANIQIIVQCVVYMLMSEKYIRGLKNDLSFA